jgi:hypothetical protein
MRGTSLNCFVDFDLGARRVQSSRGGKAPVVLSDPNAVLRRNY